MESRSPIFEGLPKKQKHKEIRLAVCKAIDSFEVGQKFNGKMIQKKASEFYPGIKKTYLETIMRYMRKYRRDECVCIDRSNSIYLKRAKEAAND